MLILVVVLAVLAVALLWSSANQRKKTGVPAGRIISADTAAWGLPQKDPLYDAGLKLVGKPDYLIREHGNIIPIEIKSCAVKDAPYDSHIFQLAAYCKLVESTTGRRPPYGILHYRNRTYSIEYTPWLEEQLLDTLSKMRSSEKLGEVTRSHQSPGRCKSCGYRSTCDDRL